MFTKRRKILMTSPLEIYSKFVLANHFCLAKSGKWPMADCYFMLCSLALRLTTVSFVLITLLLISIGPTIIKLSKLLSMVVLVFITILIFYTLMDMFVVSIATRYISSELSSLSFPQVFYAGRSSQATFTGE